jgi:hypothetical protein
MPSKVRRSRQLAEESQRLRLVSDLSLDQEALQGTETPRLAWSNTGGKFETENFHPPRGPGSEQQVTSASALAVYSRGSTDTRTWV